MKRITVCFFILAFFLLSVTACTAEVSYPDGYVGDVLSPGAEKLISDKPNILKALVTGAAYTDIQKYLLPHMARAELILIPETGTVAVGGYTLSVLPGVYANSEKDGYACFFTIPSAFKNSSAGTNNIFTFTGNGCSITRSFETGDILCRLPVNITGAKEPYLLSGDTAELSINDGESEKFLCLSQKDAAEKGIFSYFGQGYSLIAIPQSGDTYQLTLSLINTNAYYGNADDIIVIPTLEKNYYSYSLVPGIRELFTDNVKLKTDKGELKCDTFEVLYMSEMSSVIRLSFSPAPDEEVLSLNIGYLYTDRDVPLKGVDSSYSTVYSIDKISYPEEPGQTVNAAIRKEFLYGYADVLSFTKEEENGNVYMRIDVGGYSEKTANPFSQYLNEGDSIELIGFNGIADCVSTYCTGSDSQQITVDENGRVTSYRLLLANGQLSNPYSIFENTLTPLYRLETDIAIPLR